MTRANPYAFFRVLVRALVAGVVVASATSAVAPSPAAAMATIHVDLSAIGAADGSSWNDAHTTLTAGLNSASPGDTILMAEGTYFGPGGGTTAFTLIDAITIAGGYEAGGGAGPDASLYPTILSGDRGAVDVVPADPNDPNRSLNDRVLGGDTLTNVELRDLTITNGHVRNRDGGGLRLFDVDITLIGVTTQDNTTLSTTGTTGGKGGAIFISGGSLTIVDSTFASNHARTDETSVFSGLGGAIFAENAPVTIDGSDFEGNTTYNEFNSGAVVYVRGNSLEIDDSSFESNTGGILVLGEGISPGFAVAEVRHTSFLNTDVALSLRGDDTVRPASIIDAVTVENGSAFEIFGTGAEISDVTTTGGGGGIFVSSSTTTIDNAQLSSSLGRVSVFLGANVTLSDSSISGSSLWPLSTNSGTLRVLRSNIVENSGVAVRNSGGTIEIVASTLADNDASSGGAINSTAGTTTFVNSLITGNTGPNGSFANVAGGSVSFINSTIADNSVDALASWATVSGGSISSTNSIWWGNGPPQTPMTISGTGTVAFDHSVVDGSGGSGNWDAAFGTDGGGNLDVDPAFIDPATDNYRLSTATLVADTGDSAAVPADSFDIDGDTDLVEPTPDLDLGPRMLNAAVDPGAYESNTTGVCQPTLYVDHSAPGSTGGTWATAFNDVQPALSLARGQCAGVVSTINVAEGTYVPHASDAAISFEMISGVEVIGGFTAGGSPEPDLVNHPTVLSGDLLGDDDSGGDNSENSYHVVTSPPGSPTGAVLRSVTVVAGNAREGTFANGYGGGILARSPVTIDEVTVTGNRAALGGGGIEIGDDDVIVTASTIALNTAGNGGGISISSGATPTIRTSVIEDNQAVSSNSGGGGIAVTGSATIEDSIITGNSGRLGAGIRVSGGSPTLSNLVITDNQTSLNGAGAGIYAKDAEPWSLTNSLVASNDAETNGGGIFAWNADPTITNSTIVDNTTGSQGAGIFHTGPTVVTLQNTIVWDNAIQGFATVEAESSNTPTLLPGAGNTSVDPQFIGGSDYRLGASPLLDAGNDALVPIDATDLDDDGVTAEPQPDLDLGERIEGAAVDLGAFEGGTPQVQCPAAIFVDQSAVGGDGSSWTAALTEARDAFVAAAACSGTTTINIATGTYTPSVSSRLDSFGLVDGLTVVGGWATGGTAGPDNDAHPTILSGDLAGDGNEPTTNADNSRHVLLADSVSDFSVEHVTIIGGNADAATGGGGAHLSAASGSFSNVMILENETNGRGGGLLVDEASQIAMVAVTVADNEASSGGGIAIVGPDSTLDLTDALITQNTAANGGGVASSSAGGGSIIRSEISDNSANADGGGIYVQNGSFGQGGQLTIAATQITGNSAVSSQGGRGGGIFGFSARLDLTSVVVADNSALRGGGLFFDDDGENFSPTEYPTLTNVTIALNEALPFGGPGYVGAGEGGGLWIEVNECFECDPTGPLSTDAINLILASNTSFVGSDLFAGGDAFAVGNSNVTGSGGSADWNPAFGGDLGGNIDVDPQFVDAAGGDWSLEGTSPSVDTGDASFVPLDDFDVDDDGDTSELTPAVDLSDREQGTAIDMGAFERSALNPLQVVPVAACAIFDSRSSSGSLIGPLDGGEIRTLQASGPLPANQGVGTATCVPTGAAAVAVTITAHDPQALGNLRLYPTGATPNGGVVNFTANGLDNSNTVTIPLSTDGELDLAANSSPAGIGSVSTDVRIVVVGVFPDPDAPSGIGTPLDYVAVTPCAVADSRSGQGGSGAWLGPFTVSDDFPDVDVVGTFDAAQGGGNTTCGIPAGAAGIVANLVAVSATGTGTLSAAPSPTDPSEPTTSFAAIGMNNATTVILPLIGESVAIDIDGDSGATVEVRLVVLGYLAEGGAQYNPLTACAAFDTRPNVGAVGTFSGRRVGDAPTTYQIGGSLPAAQGGNNGGSCGVPTSATSVLINLVAISPLGAGNLRVAATGTTPSGGVLNFAALDPAMNNSNAVVVPLDAQGRLDVTVNGGASGVGIELSHVRGVVLGYYD